MSNKLVQVKSTTDLFEKVANSKRKCYYMAGGSDLNIQINKKMIKDSDILFIGNLKELKKIQKVGLGVEIGSGVTFGELINSQLIKDTIPLLSESLLNFASPLLQNIATIGGNIANGSPTADVAPVLLVLDAQLILLSQKGTRKIKLSEFYTGYKQSLLKEGEIIKAICVNFDKSYKTFYKKVSSRKSLTIAKLSLAALYKTDNHKIKDIRLAVGSLNEYPRRLTLVEKCIKDGKTSHSDLEKALKQEITPITDLRSDASYRFDVCLNLIKSLATLDAI